jgi:hypothetical protein
MPSSAVSACSSIQLPGDSESGEDAFAHMDENGACHQAFLDAGRASRAS